MSALITTIDQTRIDALDETLIAIPRWALEMLLEMAARDAATTPPTGRAQFRASAAVLLARSAIRQKENAT
jgi:hypothetical protein